MWELLTGEDFMKDTSFMSAIEEKIKSGVRPNIPSFTPPYYQKLVRVCWSNESTDRPSFDQVVQILEQKDANFTVKAAPPLVFEAAPAGLDSPTSSTSTTTTKTTTTTNTITSTFSQPKLPTPPQPIHVAQIPQDLPQIPLNTLPPSHAQSQPPAQALSSNNNGQRMNPANTPPSSTSSTPSTPTSNTTSPYSVGIGRRPATTQPSSTVLDASGGSRNTRNTVSGSPMRTSSSSRTNGASSSSGGIPSLGSE